MARRKVERTALFSATEALLIEQGYPGFHFKSLSERLNIGRSTLYEYYASKEELLTDYMEYVMEAIIDDCNELPPSNDPIFTLNGMLKIFLKYCQIHQITQVLPLIDPHFSPQVEASLASLKRDQEYLYKTVSQLIDEGKLKRVIRDDIETPIIAGMVFNTIQVPNLMKVEKEEWIEMVLKILFNGIRS